MTGEPELNERGPNEPGPTKRGPTKREPSERGTWGQLDMPAGLTLSLIALLALAVAIVLGS